MPRTGGASDVPCPRNIVTVQTARRQVLWRLWWAMEQECVSWAEGRRVGTSDDLPMGREKELLIIRKA